MSKIKYLLGFIAVLIVSLPLAFVATILIHPFGRWFESTTGVESYGHSGPAAWCYWAAYLIIVLILIILLYKFHVNNKKNENSDNV